VQKSVVRRLAKVRTRVSNHGGVSTSMSVVSVDECSELPCRVDLFLRYVDLHRRSHLADLD
jgi:hypothetical protein